MTDKAERRCDCENEHCKEDHKAGNCKHKGEHKAMHGRLCDACSKHMPNEYMKESAVLDALQDYLSKVAQIFQNYDYAPTKTGPGVGLYHDFDNGKVKSVKEWRKKNKKRQKANEKKIIETRLAPNKKASDLHTTAETLKEKWLKTATFAGSLDEQMKLVRKTINDLHTEVSYLVFGEEEGEDDLTRGARTALELVGDLHYLLHETFDKATTTPGLGAFSPWLVLLQATRKAEQIVFDLDDITTPDAAKSQKLADDLLKQLQQSKQLAQLEEGDVDAPSELTNQVDKNVEELSQEDVHPDHPEYQDPIEDAENWEGVAEDALWKKKNPNALDMDDARDSAKHAMMRLAEKLNEKWLFRGEMTEELEEKFTAIHENMTLLHRELMAMELEHLSAHKKEFVATENIADIQISLKLLNETEKLLKPERFLRFDFNREYGVISGALERMQELQEYLHHMSKQYPKALKYTAEIIHDLIVASDLFARQDETLDKGIRVEPTRMSEQVDIDPDQISAEELHPDDPLFHPESDIEFRESFPDKDDVKRPYMPFNADDLNNATTRKHISDTDLETIGEGAVLWLKGIKSEDLIKFLDTLKARGLDLKYQGPGDHYVVCKNSEDREEWDDTYLSGQKEDDNNSAPKGWKKTVERMKKHKDITNPFALSYWMKERGDKPHPHKKK